MKNDVSLCLTLSFMSNLIELFLIRRGCVYGNGSFVFWGHHFRSTFIASRYKFIINNEERRGEEDE